MIAQLEGTSYMIHVATVHWLDDCWIDLQLDALRKHSSEPFRSYAFLNRLPEANAEAHAAKFDYVSTEDVADHRIKLNLLADMICFAARDPDDLLLFLDGDAFPIGDYAALAREHLPERKLIAVKRTENNGDKQPAPCFCITTVGFWQEIRGDWKKGHTWEDLQGRHVTDTGGNLLHILEERNVDWMPLLRSNRRNLHPLFFGVYADVVYHHGAGFRVKGDRLTKATVVKEEGGRLLARVLDTLPKYKIVRKLNRRIHPVSVRRREQYAKDAELSKEVFGELERDPDWYRTLL